LTENVKDRILKAATIEFAEKGKAGARMQVIADKAKINKAMLNYYFTNKELLFNAVYGNMIETHNRLFIETLFEVTNARDFIRKYIFLHLKLTKENPNFIRLYLRNFLNPEQDEFQEAKTNLGSYLESRIQEYIDNGEIRSKTAYDVVVTLMGLLVAPVLFPEIHNFDDDNSEVNENLESRLNSIMNVLENGIIY